MQGEMAPPGVKGEIDRRRGSGCQCSTDWRSPAGRGRWDWRLSREPIAEQRLELREYATLQAHVLPSLLNGRGACPYSPSFGRTHLL